MSQGAKLRAYPKSQRGRCMIFGDPSLPERFWQKVQTEPNTGCWLWLGFTDKKGYGKFWYKGKSRWAHRVTKKFRRTAHHKCYVNCCVNPEHMLDVSRERNSHFGHSDQYWERELRKYEAVNKTMCAEGENAPF